MAVSEARKQALREYRAKWRADNRDKERAYSKKYRDTHSEENKLRRQRWREDNRDKYLASARRSAAKWRENNREKKRIADRQYCKTHSAQQLAKFWRRYAQKLKAAPGWLTAQDWVDIEGWYSMAKILGQTVDHIVPLRGKNVCGLHVPWNLQLLSFSENVRKGNRLDETQVFE